LVITSRFSHHVSEELKTQAGVMVANRKQEEHMAANISPQAILVIAQDYPTGAFARTPHHFAELSKKMNLLVYEVSN
jgi:hypothetical protein